MRTDRGGLVRRSTDRSSLIRRSTDRLNLSRQPFVNNRPVTRAAVLLWGVGFLLLLTNVFSFWSYLESSRTRRAEIKAGEARIAAARQAIARAEEQASRLDLNRQNDEVYYLNGKIAQRTFSWSRLLDRLAVELPSDVRLQRLAPHGSGDEREDRLLRRTAVRRIATDRVTLQIDGQAKSDEALLELVDDLFADPAFVEPNLTREAHDQDGLIRFNLNVGYLPNAPVAAPSRPLARHWRLTPEPASPGLQAGPSPPAPAFRAAPRPPPPAVPPRIVGPGAAAPSLTPGAAPSVAPGATSGVASGVAPIVRPVPQPLRPAPRLDDPLRGVGPRPQLRRPPPPEEGGR